MTIAKMLKNPNQGGHANYPTTEIDIEDTKHGMPFYFKDLRDDTYIVFRAYITGITENVAPSWTPSNYIGRSEPVWVYERAERDITFTLKLVAGTPYELKQIYRKMNRLTSLCYPEYQADEFGGQAGKQRMKPPLTQFRMGELFGSKMGDLTGFIKTLSYTVPDSAVWETKNGARVPKMLDVNLGYQVMHAKTPSLEFTEEDTFDRFYGINRMMLEED
tara:strand:- start:120 stop:773 length:654 start_codon:yes stop_codon:yes gene_type:complete